MSIKVINDIEIYYEIHGEGQPLLFIHGLGSSTKDWEQQLGFFEDQYQVITIDLRGHGQTTKAKGDYSIELFAEDIANLLQALKKTEVHVVGFSLGGMIAFQLAINYPELVKTMVIVNSCPKFPFTSYKANLIFGLRLIMIRLMSLEKVGKSIALRLFPKKEQQQLRKQLIERFITNDKASYIKALKSIVAGDVKEYLHKIKCPCLILAADHDYTSIQCKKDYIKFIANAQLQVIKNCRHAIPLEKPEEFNQTLLKFLKEKE